MTRGRFTWGNVAWTAAAVLGWGAAWAIVLALFARFFLRVTLPG